MNTAQDSTTIISSRLAPYPRRIFCRKVCMENLEELNRKFLPGNKLRYLSVGPSSGFLV
jgi:hypothetical protein